jgi:hypothetical protein
MVWAIVLLPWVGLGMLAEQEPEVWQAGWVMAAVGGGVLWLMYGTSYRIAQGQLKFRCGPFWWTLPLHRIEEVGPSHHLMMGGLSLGWSLRFLLVRVHDGWDWKITPEDDEAFLEALVQADPGLHREGDRVIRGAE